MGRRPNPPLEDEEEDFDPRSAKRIANPPLSDAVGARAGPRYDARHRPPPDIPPIPEGALSRIVRKKE